MFLISDNMIMGCCNMRAAQFLIYCLLVLNTGTGINAEEEMETGFLRFPRLWLLKMSDTQATRKGTDSNKKWVGESKEDIAHQSSFSDWIYWISVFSPNPFSHTEVLLVGYILHWTLLNCYWSISEWILDWINISS